MQEDPYKNRKTKSAVITDELWLTLATSKRKKLIPSIYLYAEEVIENALMSKEGVLVWDTELVRTARNLRIRDDIWDSLMLFAVEKKCHTWQLLEYMLRQDLFKKGIVEESYAKKKGEGDDVSHTNNQ